MAEIKKVSDKIIEQIKEKGVDSGQVLLQNRKIGSLMWKMGNFH